MKNSKVLFLVLCVSLSLLIGCGGGGGGGGGGGDSAITNPTAADPTNPIVPGAPTGSSKVTVSIKFPTLSIRAAAVTGSGTVLGKLYVNDILVQQKNATVNAGAVTLVFESVPDSGTARVDLELTGCHINGVTKFTGSAAIGADIILNVEPVYPTGTLKTADGRVLTEIGTPNNLGWVTAINHTTFNDLGQPIGLHVDGWITNYATNQKLLRMTGLKYDGHDVGISCLAWYNGKLLLGFNEMIYQLESDGSLSIFSGQRQVHTNTVDGATKANATFNDLDDMAVINGVLYLSTYTRFMKLEGNTFKVISTPSHFDGFSVTEDGEIFLLNYSANGRLNVAKLIGTDVALQPQFEPEDQNQQATMDIVKYRDGYLQAIMGQVRFIKSGAAPVSFMTTQSMNVSSEGIFGVYKSSIGELFLCSDAAHKIWKLN